MHCQTLEPEQVPTGCWTAMMITRLLQFSVAGLPRSRLMHSTVAGVSLALGLLCISRSFATSSVRSSSMELKRGDGYGDNGIHTEPKTPKSVRKKPISISFLLNLQRTNARFSC